MNELEAMLTTAVGAEDWHLLSRSGDEVSAAAALLPCSNINNTARRRRADICSSDDDDEIAAAAWLLMYSRSGDVGDYART